MKPTFTAVIPARGGSRRLKDKHTIPYAGSNLLIHKIRQLKKVDMIDKIVVSSDSDAMLEMAKKEGVLTHKRAPEYCDETTKGFGEVVRHIAESVEGEHLVWCQCTSPLVVSSQYEEAIKIYLANLDKYDSLASVEAFQRHLWDDNGPVNYERGVKHPPSQQLPKMYFVTGVFIAPRAKMIEWSHNIGPNPYKYILPRVSCVDIDDELDFELAQIWHDRICDCNKKG